MASQAPRPAPEIIFPKAFTEAMAALAKPRPDASFRAILLDSYLALSNSPDLSNWLRDIGQDPGGTVDEKIERIRRTTKYLSMSAEDFPAQTFSYLEPMSVEQLAQTCETLGLAPEGPKGWLMRRIMREVGFREGWLHELPDPLPSLTKDLLLPFVRWYPVTSKGDYEQDYYEEFKYEMLELLDEEKVHPQCALAHGSVLKIDFHLGHPSSGGVGVEFKMPGSNSDIQKALGQVDQYLRRYGSELIVVLFPDFLNSAQRLDFIESLQAKGITVVDKRRPPWDIG